jgi:hypothetical protein
LQIVQIELYFLILYRYGYNDEAIRSALFPIDLARSMEKLREPSFTYQNLMRFARSCQRDRWRYLDRTRAFLLGGYSDTCLSYAVIRKISVKRFPALYVAYVLVFRSLIFVTV